LSSGLSAGLLKHYGKDHYDYEDCLAARGKLLEVSRNVPSVLQRSVSIKIVQYSV